MMSKHFSNSSNIDSPNHSTSSIPPPLSNSAHRNWHSRCRRNCQFFPILLCAAVVAITSGTAWVDAASSSRVQTRSPMLPFSAEFFTSQEFDESAPFCRVDKDPCGFYDLSLDGNSQLEWVKSWCRCPAKHECVFDEPDLRHRVYRFVCRKELLAAPARGGSQSGGSGSPNRKRLVVRRTRHRQRMDGGNAGGGSSGSTELADTSMEQQQQQQGIGRILLTGGDGVGTAGTERSNAATDGSGNGNGIADVLLVEEAVPVAE